MFTRDPYLVLKWGRKVAAHGAFGLQVQTKAKPARVRPQRLVQLRLDQQGPFLILEEEQPPRTPPHRTPHPAASPAAWLPQPSPPPDSVNTHHVSDPIRDAARSGPGVRGKPCITGLRPPTGGHRSWGSESVKGCTWSHQRGNLRSREACPATKVRLQRGARREIDGEP